MRADAPIAAVAAARSPEPRAVAQLAAAVDLPDAERAQLRENGLVRVPVAAGTVVELVAEVLALLEREGFEPASCSFAVLTHSLELAPEQRTALDALLVRALPGLDRPPPIVGGRPCSVLHLGVELAARHLRPGRTALVLGADVAPADEERFFFGSAMGDAAVGLVLGGGGRCGQLRAVRSSTHVLASEGAASPAEAIGRFRAENPTAIRELIARTLADAGIGWGELAAIVPHTPYRLIWDTVATLSRFPRERILDDDLPATGHLNGNDVVVHLLSAVRAGRIRSGDVVALVSPGFGGTRGCSLVRWGSGA